MEIRDKLIEEIGSTVRAAKASARFNYYSAYVFTTASVAGSIAAALLIALDAGNQVMTAIVAAIPAAILSINSAFHFERKSAWHWKKVKLLEGLLRALLYEDEETAVISREFSKIDGQLDEEWVQFGKGDGGQESR